MCDFFLCDAILNYNAQLVHRLTIMFESRSLRRHLQLILAAILPVLVALLIGEMATYPNLAWHASLNKPAFNPPNWVFGPVKPKNPAGRNFALHPILSHLPAGLDLG